MDDHVEGKGPVAGVDNAGSRWRVLEDRADLKPRAAEPRFKHPRTPPSPNAVLPEVSTDLDAPEFYLNRELTWLNFCYRVLWEAEDPRNPLLERLKFAAIVSSNIDEFFMKRIGGLKQQLGAGVTTRTIDGRTPAEQIEACYRLVRRMEVSHHRVFRGIGALLEAEGIEIRSFPDLDPEERELIRDYYLRNIFPLVTPQASDPAHPFPFISNLSLNLLVTLGDPKTGHASLARVKVPVGAGIPRFLQLPDRRTFVPLESVMANNLDLLLPGMDVDRCIVFRVTRNANTELDEDGADDLLESIETGLRNRKFAPIVRLEVEAETPPELSGMLAAELGLDAESDVFEVEGLLGRSDLLELVDLDLPALHLPPHHPVDHGKLTTDRNIFHTIRSSGPILLHHPYQAFNTSVERFLEEASQDPKVRAIKMTFYRTAPESRAIGHLVEAARNGKQVAVVIELKAHFDERANIGWASRMANAGIHVTYGVVGLKTHCKVILAVRNDYDGLRRYAHIGTGNYHSGTARLYSDVGLLTCDDDIGADLSELFNYLTTGFQPKRQYRKLRTAPKGLQEALIQRIEREVQLHSEESPGRIQFKMNALEDPRITKALYGASQAGVQIDLIVRDSCRLRPQIPGVSETIRVISVVGRFLEHARLYYFRNGGKEEYFISSADCRRRNLNARVEIMAPIEDTELREQLRFFLDAQMNDTRSVWEMRADGSYVQRAATDPDRHRGCQERMIDWAQDRHHQATRLRTRRPRGPAPTA